MKIRSYVYGLNMNSFNHIPEISYYNHNYYVGFGNDLLYGESDDDNTTEWWLVEDNEFKYLGESYTNKGNLLITYSERRI